MSLVTIQDWIAWAGLALPFSALAWSAATYTQAKRREVQNAEYHRSFEIMDHLGQQSGSIASKMAAAYELRKYPQYADVIINVCEKAKVDGAAAEMLSSEMAATAKFLRGSQ